MFIETSAKAGYNVKQVLKSFSFYLLSFLYSQYLFPNVQLFRRVAAALPGMEADKKPPEDSKILFFYISSTCIPLLEKSFSLLVSILSFYYQFFYCRACRLIYLVFLDASFTT